ncbi:hypothetical protein DC28_08130 [Spirochaeta lutea]|uniref:DUF2178 domain-containing protein n=2 Tax=Spirochaeta lutea TaxID=1480694 RepID=A0A098QXA5_9SPIO|nr:hypothetical protein DC28_08130 [Spirochaeta lutea]
MLMSLGEIILSVLMVVLSVVKLDPFGWSMPTQLQMIILGLLIGAFGLYAGLLYRERPQDEREASHLHRASRLGYMAGVATLVVAIVVQSLNASLDPWVVITLSVMIVAKLVSRIVEQRLH